MGLCLEELKTGGAVTWDFTVVPSESTAEEVSFEW